MNITPELKIPPIRDPSKFHRTCRQCRRHELNKRGTELGVGHEVSSLILLSIHPSFKADYIVRVLEEN